MHQKPPKSISRKEEQGELAKPACPRCGYDLAGAVAGWPADRCPIDGTCSECGHTLLWEMVFFPDRFTIPGFVEHALGRTSMIKRAMITWAWTLWPPRFFRRVTVDASVNPLPLLLWLPIVLAVLHTLLVAINLLLLIYFEPSGLNGWALALLVGDTSTLPVILGPLFGFVDRHGTAWFGTWGSSSLIPNWVWASGGRLQLLHASFAYVGMSLMWAFLLLVLSTTRRLARIRAAHVFRACGYSLGTFAFIWVGAIISQLLLGLTFAVGSVRQFGSGGLLEELHLFVTNFFHGYILFLAFAWLSIWWIVALRSWGVRKWWLLGPLGCIAGCLVSLVWPMLLWSVLALPKA